MMVIKKNIKKMTGIALCASMILSTGISALGASGVPDCDESMYVTLDAYGNVEETSVVKGYYLNETKEIVDYGNYKEVHNMTTHTKPVLKDGRVTLSTEDNGEDGKVFLEGILDPKEIRDVLPWNIEVSYRLNGVDKKIEDLIHEKGVVDIMIDVIPNKLASEYYKNNMILQIGAACDMGKNLSIEAEGAQLQSVGTMKAALFMVLPGEEQHFVVRIGSDDFTFGGLEIMMVPATLDQLDRISDLKEARDTIKESADAIGDSLDVILNSLDGVQNGLANTSSGLKQLNQSRKVIENAKGQIYVDTDQALLLLNELSEKGIPFVVYAEDAQNAVNDLNENVNMINDTLNRMEEHFGDLGFGLRDLRRDLDDVNDLIYEGNNDLSKWEAAMDALSKDKGKLVVQLQKLKDFLEGIKELNQELDKLSKALAGLAGSASEVAEFEDITGLSEDEMDELEEAVDTILTALPVIPGLPDLSQMTKDQIVDFFLENPMGKLIMNTKGINIDAINKHLTEIQAVIDQLEVLINTTKQSGGAIGDVVGDTSDLAAALSRTSHTGETLISDIDSLTGTLNTYHETVKDSIQDAQSLIDTAVQGTSAMYTLMQNIENTMKTAGEPLNKGTKSTLNGLSATLDSAVGSLDQTDVIRNAKDTVEDLIDEKWNEYAVEDMTILNMDANAKKQSFTSSLNPEPKSLQIILRTKGTDEKEEELKAEVDETYYPEGNVFTRFINIIKTIITNIVDIFR